MTNVCSCCTCSVYTLPFVRIVYVNIKIWLHVYLTKVYRPKNKIPVVPVSRPTLFFSADPIIFSTRLTVRPYFLPVVAGCSYSVHTNYWTKLPKFVRRKYASLVNIDVGTLLKIAQQKTAKTMKKIFQKNFPTYLP
jgi:hypothetical protein